MSRRLVPLLLALLVLAPGALGHGEVKDGHEGTGISAPEEPAAMPRGYTGPGREPYISYFQGVWLYGQVSATTLRDQLPRDADLDGDWIVWEDGARSDIFLYSRSAGQGYYVTNDGLAQHRPRISDGVVVYEQTDSRGRGAIYAHHIDTSETRRLSDSRSNVHHPDIDGGLVAWVDDHVTNADIWAHSLVNQTTWPVHQGTDRDSDPLVLDDRIYYRSYRFNLWDVASYDASTGDTYPVTSDPSIQSAPFTNGRDVLFYTRLELGWTLQRYDVRNETLETTPVRSADASRSSASSDHIVRLARDGDVAQIVIRNVTDGATNHVSGDLIVLGAPLIDGSTVLAFLDTADGTSLLQLEVSPFAFGKRPTLTITGPSAGSPWLRPLVMSGLLQAGPQFTEPSSFTYRVDDRPPQTIPAAERWRATLDPAGLDPGTHTIVVRATFREGPPISATTTLNVPAAEAGVDVEQAGATFHAARIMGEVNEKIVQNPAAWVLLPLLLILVALLALRVWIYLKPMRASRTIEYVPPDDA